MSIMEFVSLNKVISTVGLLFWLNIIEETYVSMSLQKNCQPSNDSVSCYLTVFPHLRQSSLLLFQDNTFILIESHSVNQLKGHFWIIYLYLISLYLTVLTP